MFKPRNKIIQIEEPFSKTWVLTWAVLTGWVGISIYQMISAIVFNQEATIEGIILFIVFFAVWGLPIGFFTCFFLGHASLSILKFYDILNLKSVVIIGAIFGYLFSFPYFWLMSPHSSFMQRPSMAPWGHSLDVVLMVLIGGIAGYVGYKRGGRLNPRHEITIFET